MLRKTVIACLLVLANSAWADAAQERLAARAQQAESAGQLLLAERDYRYLARQYPAVADYPYSLARVLIKQSKPAAGFEALQAALSIDDKYVPALLMKADFEQHQGNAERAIALYEQVLDIDSAQPAAVVALISLYEKQGNETRVRFYEAMRDALAQQ